MKQNFSKLGFTVVFASVIVLFVVPIACAFWQSSFVKDFGSDVGYTFISITNVNPATAKTVTVEFYDTDGNLIDSTSRSVPPNGTWTLGTESGGGNIQTAGKAGTIRVSPSSDFHPWGTIFFFQSSSGITLTWKEVGPF